MRVTFDQQLQQLNEELTYMGALCETAIASAARALWTGDVNGTEQVLRDDADNDFYIRNLAAAADSAAETTRVMSLLLGAIASVSLLVGGIGIMNIMLVSVTERTREIGIRMAIGARQRDILAQFLFEALMISVAGCLIGLFVGVGGALLTNALTDMVIVISGTSVLVSFAVAAGVGVFFGYYPARRAAALDPIEALRHQ